MSKKHLRKFYHVIVLKFVIGRCGIVTKIFELHVWIREFGRLEDRNDCSIGVELTDSFRMEEDFTPILCRASQVSRTARTRASEALALWENLDLFFEADTGNVIVQITIQESSVKAIEIAAFSSWLTFARKNVHRKPVEST